MNHLIMNHNESSYNESAYNESFYNVSSFKEFQVYISLDTPLPACPELCIILFRHTGNIFCITAQIDPELYS